MYSYSLQFTVYSLQMITFIGRHKGMQGILL